MQKQQTILIAEDERKAADTLRLYLEHANYRVLIAHDGKSALAAARAENVDLVLLDWMLPSLSGIDVCRAVRAESAVPIVMLTARTTEEEKLRGLNLGADDYITKPFSPREVVARVKAVLRRSAREDSAAIRGVIINVGDVRLDAARHEVFVGGTRMDLTPTEFRLMEVFLRAPGRAFRRDELIAYAFGDESDALDRTVDAHVKNLRAKLSRRGGRGCAIETVHGIGYKFCAGASERDE